MSPKTKKILGAVVAIAVIGSVVGFSVSRENRKKITVQTGKVEKKSLTQVVTASGEVRPRRYVNVGANVSGRLIDITVIEGQRVKKGQMLARVEAERYEAGARQGEAGVAAARAELTRSEADLAGAKLAYDRNKRMRDDKLVSESAYDQAEAEFKMKAAGVEAAKRRVAQLQAQLDSTKDELYKTTVYSPMDGVVTNLPKEAGEMVIGAVSFSPTVIMTVADLSVMECEVMVDETDFRNLKLGQEAKIKVEALEGLELKGEEKDGVFVVEGEKALFKPVKTGIMGESDIEITEGIDEGKTIVTGSYKTLRNLKDDARIKVEQKGKKS